MSLEDQVAALSLLTYTREHGGLQLIGGAHIADVQDLITLAINLSPAVARLKLAAEHVRQLERHINRLLDFLNEQDAKQVADLVKDTANSYASCAAEVNSLTSHNNPLEAVPQQLQAMGQQISNRLQAALDGLHTALSNQIRNCLAQCGWPPPLVPSQSGGEKAFDPALLFSTREMTDTLQRLMVALTRLQLAAQKDAIGMVMQSAAVNGSLTFPDAPLLWMAEELAAPLTSQILELFGPSNPGSPGALDNPDLVLGTVHRLAQENGRRIDFLQGVIQAMELHSTYHIGTEFTRALREAVKQLLRMYKLPEVASAANRDLWLAWIDALIAFEGSLGRSALLGCYWDVADAGDMPVVLLQGSTLSVLGENHHWMDAWLDAEAASAASQVESVLYSEQGWAPGQQLLVEEGRPAWQVDFWPPRAAEEVAALVESLLARLRFIPQPEAQERYLAGAVGAVLQQAHGRILRMLQQADVFKDLVCMCICFCHYVEQQLQDLHDHTQVLVTRLLDSQQQQQLQLPHNQRPEQHSGPAKHLHHQHQQHALANGNGNGSQNADGWQTLQQPQGQSGESHRKSIADVTSGTPEHLEHRQQQQASEKQSQAAAAKLRLLSRPISDFSTCRREWVLKLGKAAAMGFVQQASGYFSRGGLFKATSDALPAMAAGGTLWSSGVVSGPLQPALAWLSGLLHALSEHLDKDCFRQAWGAAAAAINRELFNNVACEAMFSDAGALQLVVDLQAILRVFGRYTARPAPHFRELGDATKLLNLPQEQAEFIKQAVSSLTRAQNAAEVLKSVGVYHLDPDLADTVLSLRMYK
eukprot:gene7466-7676_t